MSVLRLRKVKLILINHEKIVIFAFLNTKKIFLHFFGQMRVKPKNTKKCQYIKKIFFNMPKIF